MGRRSRFVRKGLQILQDTLRFFDIRWPQNDQTLFHPAAAGEICVFDIELRFGETLRSLEQQGLRGRTSNP